MPGTCSYCGTQLKRGNSPRGASIDHLIPSATLRRNPRVYMTDQQRAMNKLLCCISCNGRKGDMDPRQWLAHIQDPKRRLTVTNILQQLPITEFYR